MIPYAAVALLWANGKTVSQISDDMGWTKSNNRFPYSYAYGVLKRLRSGVSIDGLTIRINKKKQQARNQRESIQSRSVKLECPLCGTSSSRLIKAFS